VADRKSAAKEEIADVLNSLLRRQPNNATD
jgi:hypothetical protein